MSTCNWLHLQTLESQPVMPKNLPDHWLLLHSILRHLDSTTHFTSTGFSSVDYTFHIYYDYNAHTTIFFKPELDHNRGSYM
jgi:hypothetical protein